MGAAATLSVIIPTLNEAATLPNLLNNLAQQTNLSLQIIIADGGSDDGTLALVPPNTTITHSTTGRGQQMNTGAAQATHDYLLFLHADSTLPHPQLLSNAITALQQAEHASPNTLIAGHFPLHFVRQTPQHAVAYAYLELKTRLNRPGTVNGDQGLLISRQHFYQLGGFDTRLPFLEDQRIAAKIRSQGRWLTLPGMLHTAARRFETEGFHRRYLLMTLIMTCYTLGEDEFFTAAPAIYRAQHHTHHLLLTPFFRLLRQQHRRWGWRKSVRNWQKIGAYAWQNGWQAAALLDTTINHYSGSQTLRCLACYDRIIAPILTIPIIRHCLHGAAALVFSSWLFAIVAPLYRWRERHALKTTPNN